MISGALIQRLVRETTFNKQRVQCALIAGAFWIVCVNLGWGNAHATEPCCQHDIEAARQNLDHVEGLLAQTQGREFRQRSILGAGDGVRGRRGTSAKQPFNPQLRKKGRLPAVDQHTCGGEPATIVGSPGNDVINGTNGADVIVGLGGRDAIYGRGGADVICGGDGNDKLYGNAGRDRLYGDAGNDYIEGNMGRDRLYGGVGNDRLYGGGGADILYGGSGDDVLGGAGPGGYTGLQTGGPDTLYGGPGHDGLWGGTGKDYLDGGEGFDECNDGPGRRETKVGCEQ